MGFTIANYNLMGIPLQNIYVSVKGRFSIVNSSFMYNVMMSKRYQIYADYFFSLNKDSPRIESRSITIDLDDVPQNIYATIYEAIKKNLDINYGTQDQVLIFTDD